MVPSAVPWISSTLTGLDGVHSAGLSNIAPAKLTMAAIWSAWSHAIRYAMNPPLEWPTTYTRLGSTLYLAATAAMTPLRYAESSTGKENMLQHASVAFQKRLPIGSMVPSGCT